MVRWDDGSRHRRWTSTTSISYSNSGAGWLKSETTKRSTGWRWTWNACQRRQLAPTSAGRRWRSAKQLHEAGSDIDRVSYADPTSQYTRTISHAAALANLKWHPADAYRCSRGTGTGFNTIPQDARA